MDRRTKHIIILIVWVALFFTIGFNVWNFQAGELMVMIYLVTGVLAYIICAFLNRCPRCRMPLLLRPVRRLGVEFYLWSLLTPNRCRHCGEPID